MRKFGVVFLAAVIFFVVLVFFLAVAEAGGGGKTVGAVSASTERQKIVWRAELLRTQFLALCEKQTAATEELGAFLRAMKKAENVSKDFFQDRIEKSLDTWRSSFWSKKDVVRKKFFVMPLKELRLEVKALEAAVVALGDCLEFFAAEMALMKSIFGDSERPSPLVAPQPSVLKPVSIGVVADPAPGGNSVAEAEELRNQFVELYEKQRDAILEFFSLIDEGEKKYGMERGEYGPALKNLQDSLLRFQALEAQIKDYNFLVMSAGELADRMAFLKRTNAALEKLLLGLQQNNKSLKKKLEAKKREVPA